MAEDEAKTRQLTTMRDVAAGMIQPLASTSSASEPPVTSVPRSSVSTIEPVVFARPSFISVDRILRIGRHLLVKYWIWMVASMLLLMSLLGDRVVIYRIVYMFMFLTFVLMFQVRV